MSNNLNMLITGGAGFIGSELVSQAAKAGFDITIVDNLLNGKRENIEKFLCDRVRLVVGDIRDADLMKSQMKGRDIVYHLACLCVRHSIHSPLENHEVNARGTLNLLLAAREVGVKQFVFTSSAEVYGSITTPKVSEDHPTVPTNVYGGAKLAAEGYSHAFYRSYGVPTVVLRLFNTYGPNCHHEGDCGEVVPKFLLRGLAGKPLVIFGDGKQTRDFNYVSDTAEAVLKAGLVEGAVGKTINIGSGRETSINELATQVLEAIGLPNIPIMHDSPRPGDIARMCADGERAWKILGYRPKLSISQGLKLLLEWCSRREKPLEECLGEEVVHNWEMKELEGIQYKAHDGIRL
jgi:UDP-glucose 4-epimerase